MNSNGNAIVDHVFEGTTIRTVQRDDGVWWVAKDVCDVLGLHDTSRATASLKDDEKLSTIFSRGIRGNPTRTLVNEPGLYRLIFKSRKPDAERFKRWVFHEVLPSLRVRGSYEPQPPTIDRDLVAGLTSAIEALATVLPRPPALPANMPAPTRSSAPPKHRLEPRISHEQSKFLRDQITRLAEFAVSDVVRVCPDGVAFYAERFGSTDKVIHGLGVALRQRAYEALGARTDAELPKRDNDGKPLSGLRRFPATDYQRFASGLNAAIAKARADVAGLCEKHEIPSWCFDRYDMLKPK